MLAVQNKKRGRRERKKRLRRYTDCHRAREKKRKNKKNASREQVEDVVVGETSKKGKRRRWKGHLFRERMRITKGGGRRTHLYRR